jgi:hypothetical protein
MKNATQGWHSNGVVLTSKRKSPKVVLHHNGKFSLLLNGHWQRQLDRLELPTYRDLSSDARHRVMRHPVRYSC